MWLTAAVPLPQASLLQARLGVTPLFPLPQLPGQQLLAGAGHEQEGVLLPWVSRVCCLPRRCPIEGHLGLYGSRFQAV